MEREIKGILGEKLGMTQIWDKGNRLVPVTAVKAGPCVVTQVRTPERDGYNAVQLGYGAVDPRKVNKPVTGHYDKAGVPPRRHLVELRTADAGTYTLGQEITADIFDPGDPSSDEYAPIAVDVISTSKGKGFSGVMKRHGFSGLGAGHGVQRKHRSPGSIGGCATPGRVFKGLRMAGRHGGERTTVLNLEVVKVDAERGILLIKGPIPGANGSLVLVRSAVKSPVRKQKVGGAA